MKIRIIGAIGSGIILGIAVFLCYRWFNVEIYKTVILYILFGFALNIENATKND
jgi:hypothetical protein